MAAVAESSSAPLRNDKPLIVRVKRKASQCRLDAFWLEINERPLKRALLDFEKLSVSDSSSTRVVDLKTTKVLVQHVETVTSSENSIDVLRSFLPNSSNAWECRKDSGSKRRIVKTINKQDKLLAKAKQRQEVLSRDARYEQIWRSRKGKKDAQEDEALHEMCRLYDVVKIDVNVQEIKVKQKDTNLEDYKMMAQYLPLLREVLPTAAVEVENDIHDNTSNQVSSEDYVYDIYAVSDDAHTTEADFGIQYPLVQVDNDDEYYDGPDTLDYESDDSNAENNPLNDYPDEEDSEDDDEATSRSSHEKSEDESRTSGNGSEDLDEEDSEDDEATSMSTHEKSEDESRTSGNGSEDLESKSQASYEDENSGPEYLSDDADKLFEDEMYSEGEDEFDDYSRDE